MPRWYYDKKDLRNTPSIRDGGIEFEGERRYRVEGARFIMQTGTSMSLGHNTIATGIVYFHRFYMFHSFNTFPRYVTACCCLFLAGKVEETPKKCRDIIRIAKNILSDQKFQSFGDDPKEEVMTLERILLQTIKFDLQVDHPYSFLLRYAKCLKGDAGKIQKMVQMAWNFVNDSLSTTLSLQWEPEIIAVALIYLACKLSKFNVTDWIGRVREHIKWWDMFVQDVTMDVLEDICHQVLDLYQQPIIEKMPESPPQLPPSKASPPAKRAKFPVPPSPSTSSLLPKMSSSINNASSIPVKVSSNEAEVHMMPKIVQPSMHYGYASTSSYSMYPQPPMPSVAQHNPPLPTSYARPPLPPPMPGPSSGSYHQRLTASTSSHYYSQQHLQQHPHQTHGHSMSFSQYSNHPSGSYYNHARAPPPHQQSNHPPHHPPHRTNTYYRHHQ